jgi:hypothetical protein
LTPDRQQHDIFKRTDSYGAEKTLEHNPTFCARSAARSFVDGKQVLVSASRTVPLQSARVWPGKYRRRRLFPKFPTRRQLLFRGASEKSMSQMFSVPVESVTTLKHAPGKQLKGWKTLRIPSLCP